MSDLERLDEALELTHPAVASPMDGEQYQRRVLIFNAARAYRNLLANGERVEWCRVHDGNPSDCEHKAIYDEICDVVSALVDPPKEEER